MTDVLEKLAPFDVLPSGLLVPGDRSISYPGNDAWLELQAQVQDPGADPAWAMVETVPDTGAIPNKTVTAAYSNLPTISTATSKFGGSSLLSSGASYALTTPDHADWTFGAGDFTIEGWYYCTLIRTALVTQLTAANTDRGWEFTADIMASANPGFTFLYSTGDGTAWEKQADWAYPVSNLLNTWTHQAVVRFGTALKCFVNGTQVGSDFNCGTDVLRNSGAPLTIGGDARSAGANDFRGYTDEVRISKGIARYTSNFTPPAAAFTRDQYTVLLMHFDGPNGGTAYIDSSGQAGAPFDPGSDPAWMEVER